MGWFLSGTLIGPAIGPFVGGIIVTYTDWTVIFWVQAGLAGVAALGAFFLLPETIHHKKYDDLEGLSKRRKVTVLANMINPWRVLKLFLLYPNLYVRKLYFIRSIVLRMFVVSFGGNTTGLIIFYLSISTVLGKPHMLTISLEFWSGLLPLPWCGTCTHSSRPSA